MWGEHRKQYYLLNFLGVILFILSLMTTHDQEPNLFLSLSMVSISFGLSIAVKLIVNQYMQIDQYNIVNTLALNNIFKMMLIIIYFYLKACHQETHLDLLTLFLRCQLLDFSSLVVGCYLVKYPIKKHISTCIVTVCFILIVAISMNLEESLVESLIRGSILVGIVVNSMIRLRWKQISQKVLYEKMPLFKVLLNFMIMYGLFNGFYISQLEKYAVTIITFQSIHVLYLFCGTFYICISSPWKERMHTLNEIEDQINEQSKNCDMIVNLSHELKTPVNVIRSALDIFILDFKEDEMLEEIKDIKKDCNIVMNIIQDMIDIQKINGRHIELRYQTYNLVEVIEGVIDAFSEEIIGSHLVFDPQEEEMNVVVDGVLMQQCFTLLFGLMLQEHLIKKLYVEMSQEYEEERLCIRIINTNIPYLEELYEQINTLDREDRKIKDVADTLTLRLICAILKLHDGEMVFDKQQSEKELRIYLKRKEVGELTWLDDRSVTALNDQIRCRYIGA